MRRGVARPLLRARAGLGARAFGTGDTTRAVYLGAELSFSHLAFQSLQRRLQMPFALQSCASLRELVQLLREDRADLAILPLESSSAGPLLEHYDTVLRHELAFVGDYSCVERHVLAATPGVRLPDIRRVLSHHAILTQCSEYLSELESVHGVPLERVPDKSSSGAARSVAGARDEAAICTGEAAEAFGLSVLQDSIGNDRNSQTRYVLVVPRGRIPPRALNVDSARRRRGSAYCILRNEPGTLLRVLGHFALRRVNICSIVLRPTASLKGSRAHNNEALHHWDYVFYFDWESDLPAAENETLIESLRQTVPGFCLLGQYVSLTEQQRFTEPAWKEKWQGMVSAMQR